MIKYAKTRGMFTICRKKMKGFFHLTRPPIRGRHTNRPAMCHFLAGLQPPEGCLIGYVRIDNNDSLYRKI